MGIKSITLHAGHNPSGKIACGASDYIDESTEARLIVKKIKALKTSDVSITDATVNNGTSQSDVLRKIVSKCNATKRELDVSIHFNACVHSTKDGKVKGCEVCVHDMNSAAVPYAKKVLAKMEKLGFTNRGVQARNNLYFLNNTNKPAMLIEVCFVDDYDDVTLYKKKKAEIAKAIYNAIFS